MTSVRRLATVGEGQIRLTLPAGVKWERADLVRFSPAGSELNVATLLARVGWKTQWHSILPRNALGRAVVAAARTAGATPVVRWVEEGRVALYWLDPGSDAVAGEVLYDRLGTPFRGIDAADIDWEAFLKSDVVYLTGISASLTDSTREVLLECASRSNSAGIDVVYDVNYRENLWSTTAAAEFTREIAQHCSLVFCSARDARRVLNVDGDSALSVARALRDVLGVPQAVVSDGSHEAAFGSATEEATVPVTAVTVLDRPGAGDAFIAGFLADPSADAEFRLRMATRAAAHAVSQYGDQTVVAREDLGQEVGGDIRR